MKPVSLTIHGLHSFRETQTIPFETLSDIGLFGIFGPTGSGKSTILDAMTLALFGSVIRATNHTQGILNHAENRVAVSFTFDAGAGDDRSRYTVERVFRRGTDAAVTHQSSRLTRTRQNGQVDVMADMKAAVTDCVTEVLGLTEDDFTKAVVLPQGKFAEFLHLTGSQRSRMMERLFGLERYGARLSETLTERERAERHQLEVLEASQLSLGDASAEALTAIEARVQEAVKRERHCANLVDEAARRLSAASEVWQLQLELADVVRQTLTHSQMADEMERQKTRLMWADRAYQVGPVVDRAGRADKAYEVAQVERDRAHRVEVEARTRRDASATLAQAAESKRAEAEPTLMERLHRLHQAEAWESELDERQTRLREVYQTQTRNRVELASAAAEADRAANSYEAVRRDMGALSMTVEQLFVSPDVRASVQRAQTMASEFEQAARHYQNQSQQVSNRQRALADATVALKAKLAEVEATRAAHVAAERQLAELSETEPVDANQLVTWEDWLRDVAQAVREWGQAEDDLTVAQQQLDRAAQDLETCLIQKQALEEKVEAARLRRDQAADIQADEWRQRREQLAAGLAQDLIEGEPCPVCGSTHHPAPVIHWEMNHAMNEIDSAAIMEVATSELNGLEADLQDCRVTFAGLEATYATTSDVLSRQSGRRQNSLDTWTALTALNTLLPGQPLINTHQMASDQLAKVTLLMDQRRSAWQAWTEAVRRAEARQLETREALQLAQFQAGTAEALRNQLVREYEDASNVAALAEQTRLTVLAELSQSLSEIAATCEDVASEGVGAALAAYSAVMEQDAAWLDARDRLSARQRDLEQCSVALERARGALAERQLQVARVEQERRHLEQAAGELERRLQAATGGARVSEAKKETNAAIQALRDAERGALEQLQLADKAVAEASNVFAAADAARLLTEQQATEVRRELTAALAKFGFATVEAAEEARLPEAERQALTEQVTAYEAATDRLRNERDRLIGRLGDRHLTEADWASLNDTATRAQTDLRTAGDARAALMTERDDVARRHQTWLTLEAKRLLLAKRCEQLAHLRQLFRGNAFVEFVAREQMEQVARDASARLQQLTQYRYALEVASDGGFIMRDDFNGGVRRPVTTLSGGETFLTSLALALALSAHVQLRGQYPLEFFFLDEGFGTLDPDLLDTVMTSLDRLRLDSLVIGVISHVPELRQRMQRRLIVDPPEAGGRGSRVRVER